MSNLWFLHFYPLLEAFERLGEQIYGDEWTYNERRTYTGVQRPKALQLRIERANRRLARAQNALRRIADRKSGEVREAELARLCRLEDSLKSRFFSAQSVINKAEEELPLASENAAALDRWETAQTTLLSALADGKLTAYEYGNSSIDQNLWRGQFNPDWVIEYSSVWLNGEHGRHRRKFVGVLKNEFWSWLKTVERRAPPRNLTVEDFCIPHLVELMTEDDAVNQLKNRDEYFEIVCAAALERGLELSHNRFVQKVWPEKPEKFAKAGRKRRN